jgi:hypothetical protein
MDIGAMLVASGKVPVVIKSVVFPTSTALGKVEKQFRPYMQPRSWIGLVFGQDA